MCVTSITTDNLNDTGLWLALVTILAQGAPVPTWRRRNGYGLNDSWKTPCVPVFRIRMTRIQGFGNPERWQAS